jgi:hypothetical protein
MNKEFTLRPATSEDKIKLENFFAEHAGFFDIFSDEKWLAASALKGWEYSNMLIFTDQNDNILLAAPAYKIYSKLFGPYMYLQHSPIISKSLLNPSVQVDVAHWGEVNLTGEGLEVVTSFLASLQKFAQANNYFCVIMEPIAEKGSDFAIELLKVGYERMEKSILPYYPLYMDLSKSEEELLNELEKNTRYNIRRAKSDGVEIRFTSSRGSSLIELKHAFSEFYALQTSVSQEKGYDIPSKDYFEKILENFTGKDGILIVHAVYQGEIISSNFTQLSKYWAGSYYTANSMKHSKLRASYLLKWETILEAKRQGKILFDMWGHVPDAQPSSPHYGYSQFKRSFNPIAKEFIGRLALGIDSNKYTAWKLAGKFRNLFTK